jgi:predicted metalloprotease with PDZ domain
MKIRVLSGAALLAAAFCWPHAAQAAVSETLSVDATDVAGQVWHARLRVPLRHGGDVVLVYPKWLPGNHGPTGPVANLGSLHATVAARTVPWERDPADVYAFHFAVPDGATELDLSYDFFEGGAAPGNITGTLAVLDWNEVVFYPRGAGMREVTVTPDITLPPGWTSATALPPVLPLGTLPSGHVQYDPVTLETLVDSPLYCGAHGHAYPLANGGGMTNEIDVYGETDADIEATPEQVSHWRRLVAEADALYGYRHWQHYHFLLTLSDAETGRGLEHHSSSANGTHERYLRDPEVYEASSDLLPHEFTHSWNGKFRRPAGLDIHDYQQPMVDDLLWVYEGLTQYWGIVLAQRSGLSDPGEFEQTLAAYYASLDAEPGRQARPLLDTAVGQALTRAAQSPSGRFVRRGEDYYNEAALMWLDADTLIRTHTHGKKSLDDFARAFLGYGKNTPPMVVPYTRADVIAALDRVDREDWAAFFRTRVDEIALHPPLAGITRGGWRFVFTAQPNRFQVIRERSMNNVDMTYSLGAAIGADGTVAYAIDGTPLALAGIPAGVKLLAVDGQAFSIERLRIAVDAATHERAPIGLIYDDLGTIVTTSVPYHGGQRYPQLVRVPGTPNLLAAIAAPKTPAGATSGVR